MSQIYANYAGTIEGTAVYKTDDNAEQSAVFGFKEGKLVGAAIGGDQCKEFKQRMSETARGKSLRLEFSGSPVRTAFMTLRRETEATDPANWYVTFISREGSHITNADLVALGLAEETSENEPFNDGLPW